MPDDKALKRELKLNQLYLAIISRYRDFIEEREHISVAELPTLVTPKNELVAKKAEDLKHSFGAYNFKANFYEASVDAFYYVKNDIEDVMMPIQFWLTPEETMTFGIGDLLDRSTLLCSLLIALGNPSSRVFVYTRAGARKVFTYYELEGKAYSLDFATGFKKFDNRDVMVRSLNLDDETVAYEFNDNMYIEVG